MLVPAVVFVGVLLLVFGPYWLLVLRDERRLLDRLQPSRVPRRGGRIEMLKPEDSMSSVGVFDAALKRSRAAGRLQTFLDQAGVKMSVAVFLLSSACLGALAFMVGLWGSRTRSKPRRKAAFMAFFNDFPSRGGL